jgi:hypothetical protein
MSSEDWRQLPRRPRYEAGGTQKLVAEVERSVDGQPALVHAEVQDLSRNGYQLRLTAPLAIQEHICLRLRIEDSGLALTLPGTVRWQRAADGAWLVGCLSDRALDWESLGELFLSTALSPDGP